MAADSPDPGWAMVLGWRAPLIGSSIALDMGVFLALWPVWWWFGVEQLVPPVFAAWQFGRCLARRVTGVRIGVTELLALALAVWSVVPVMWVNSDELAMFGKESVTLWAQALWLLVLRNEIRSGQEWDRVLAGIRAVGVSVAAGGVVYASGLWRGSITSLAGMMLPDRWIAESEFLTSISYRALGDDSTGGLLGERVWSLALHPSSASMVCLVLVPVALWGGWRRSGWPRLVAWFAASGLIVTLVMTESRAAWVALALGSIVGALLVAYRTSDAFLRLLIVTGTACAAILFGAVAGPTVADGVRRLVTEIRPQSWMTRLELYRDTVELLDEHPIAGWGHPVERPDRRRVYSAGTHSSLLGMLFQHGVVGLGLYLALWASIWWVIIRRLLCSLRSRARGDGFWIVAAVAMFAFNLRETADNWWWDQLVTTIVWSFWGLVLTSPVCSTLETDVRTGAPSGEAETVRPAVSRTGG